MKHNPIPKNEASGAGNFFKKKLSFLADLCYNWAYVFKIIIIIKHKRGKYICL